MDKKQIQEKLPNDIFYLVLIVLPVKTLGRFRCVCKSWDSLISGPLFQRDHYFHWSKKDPCLLLTRYEIDLMSNNHVLHLSSYDNNGETLISKFSKAIPSTLYSTPDCSIPSCHGLVCFCDFWKSNILICNPSTGELKITPPCRGETHCIGFGYGTSTKDFKLVRFFSHWNRIRNVGQNFCEVFTLGTSGWRKSNYPHPNRKRFSGDGPFLHGAIHFLPYGFNNRTYGAEVQFISAFDIKSEENKEIALPEYLCNAGEGNHYSVNSSLRELGGSLFLVFDFVNSMDLWVLQDYSGGEWVKTYVINFNSIYSECWKIPLLMMGNGSMLLSISFTKEYQRHDSLYSYDPVNKTFTQKTEGEYLAALYFENFLSLGSNL